MPGSPAPFRGIARSPPQLDGYRRGAQRLRPVQPVAVVLSGGITGGFLHSGGFDADDNLLAASADNTQLNLWRLPEIEANNIGLTQRGTTIEYASSPDGRYLALGGCANTMSGPSSNAQLPVLSCSPQLLVLDLETRRLLPLSFAGHTRAVLSVAFSPDGALLASGDAGGDIMLWDLSLTPQAVACRRAGRNLTHVEWQRYFGEEPYRLTCPELTGAPE